MFILLDVLLTQIKMNSNNRSNLRGTATFPRHGSSHQGRLGHNSRWHVNHVPFSKEYQQGYNQGNSERDKDLFGYPKPNGIPNQTFPMEATNADVRQLPPPMIIPSRTQVPESSVQLLNGPMLNLNPGLLTPIENTEYPQRSNSLMPEMRHTPVQQHSSSTFYRPNAQEDSRKDICAQSESPSRKRRRIVQTSQTQNGIPLPAHHQSPWEPQRNHQRPLPRNSVPIRRSTRYSREWTQENHTLPRMQHPPTFTPAHPSTSHHQPPMMMDLTQVVNPSVSVPVSLPLPLYSSGPTAPHIPPCQVHSIYCTTSPQHTCQLNNFGNCMNHHTPNHHHHHHHTSSVLFPSLAHVHYSAHITPRHEPIEIDIIMDHHHRPPTHQATILQVPTPSSIFISEVPRRTSARRWNRPFPPAPSPFPGWLHILAMFSNPPLSPYSQEVGETHHPPENYEEFLNIADRLGDVKPRGLNKAEIDQLPSFKFNAGDQEGDQTSCVICLCDFETRQILRGLPCSHQFHAKCVDKWLKSNPTCPICRGDASGYVLCSE
ncbi:unnamed protein product [Nezara viridula]|uniref:RING-type domain-containing protein n=1 Tax=Nezara viridula TaxID=85310 RepID=A0A9P0GXY6_NEZVI|nr:unnamed protein product [Nezara viridula]